MVSNKRSKIILLDLGERALLLVVVLAISFFTADLIWPTFKEYFDFQKPSGFFGFTLAEAFLEWELAIILWSGLIFGMLGKKLDYFFIIFIFILISLDYLSVENVSPQMYLGLVGVALLGNTIGYGLKLARLRWLKK